MANKVLTMMTGYQGTTLSIDREMSDKIRAWLKREAAAQGVSRSEVFRRFLKKHETEFDEGE